MDKRFLRSTGSLSNRELGNGATAFLSIGISLLILGSILASCGDEEWGITAIAVGGLLGGVGTLRYGLPLIDRAD